MITIDRFCSEGRIYEKLTNGQYAFESTRLCLRCCCSLRNEKKGKTNKTNAKRKTQKVKTRLGKSSNASGSQLQSEPAKQDVGWSKKIETRMLKSERELASLACNA